MTENSNGTNPAAEDRVWTATLATLHLQHPAVQDCVFRLAAVHWFDERLVASLLGSSPPPATVDADGIGGMPIDLLMAVVEAQTFVEVEGEARFRLHANVRESLLRGLLTLDPEFVAANENAAIEELIRRNGAAGLDYDELLELAYLLLARDSQSSLVDDIFAGQTNAPTLAMLDRLMTYVTELSQDGRLSDELTDRAKLWAVWAASAAGDYKRVVSLGSDALETLPRGSELADNIAYQIALGRSQQGELTAALDLLVDVAERRRGSGLGVLATMLRGDVAALPEEAEQAYIEALGSLVELYAPGSDTSWHDVTMWRLVTREDADGRDLGLAVSVGPGADPVVMPPEPTFAELWLRLGASESRRGRAGAASGWLDLAERFFEAIGDDDGVGRTWDSQQTLHARSEDPEVSRALVERYEARLEWARLTGAGTLELQALVDLGNAWWTRGKLQTADGHFSAAADVAQRLGQTFVAASIAESRSRIATTEERFDDAERYAGEARAGYDTTYPAAAHRLELCLAALAVARHDTEAAKRAHLRLLDWALAENRPDEEAEARMGLARLAEDRFDLTEADHQLSRAAAIASQVDPMLELDILLQRSHVLRLRARDAEADEVDSLVEQRAQELSHVTTIGWLLDERARTAARRGDHRAGARLHREALRIFEEADDRDGVFNSLVGLSWVLSEMDEQEEALATAEQANRVALESGVPSYINIAGENLGSTLVSLGKYDQAIKTLHEARRENEQDSNLSISLSWAYLRAGQFEESVRWSHEALKQNPSDFFPYRNLGHALLCLGRRDEAFAAYHQAIKGRFGDLHFNNTLDELAFIERTFPGTKNLVEAKALFERAQADLNRQQSGARSGMNSC